MLVSVPCRRLNQVTHPSCARNPFRNFAITLSLSSPTENSTAAFLLQSLTFINATETYPNTSEDTISISWYSNFVDAVYKTIKACKHHQIKTPECLVNFIPAPTVLLSASQTPSGAFSICRNKVPLSDLRIVAAIRAEDKPSK